VPKKAYRLPLKGKVKTRFPPDGFKEEPLEPIGIIKYFFEEVEPNLPRYISPEDLCYSYTVTHYDIDNNFATVVVEASQVLFDWLDTTFASKNEDELYSLTKEKKLDKSIMKEGKSKGENK